VGNGSHVREGENAMQDGTEEVQPVQAEAPAPVEEPKKESVNETDGAAEPESPRESVKRAIEELESEPRDETQDSKSFSSNGASTKKQNDGKSKEQSEPEVIRPPDRFNVKEKEIFNRAPKELQRALVDMVKGQQAQFTKTTQEAAQAKQEAAHIVEAVRPFLASNPDLMKRGYTESKVVAELIGTYQKLRNPETKFSEWLSMGSQIGVDTDLIEEIKEAMDDDGDYGSMPNPEVASLQQQVSALQSKLDGTERAKLESKTQSIVKEFHSVKDEQNADGTYKYPKLHDNSFIKQVEPLVLQALKNSPGIGYADALRNAYHAYHAMTGDFQAAPQSAGLQQNQMNNSQPRVVRPTSSVRGKTTVPSSTAEPELPVEALSSPQATVQYLLNSMKGN